MRIAIADDHPLILAGIRQALEGAPHIEVVAEARSGPEVVPLVRQTAPDLLLLDLRMPQLDGLQCLDRLREQCPNVKVVILSVATEPELISRALERGAAAYIVKSIKPRDLSSALRQIVEGTVCYTLAALTPDEDEAAKTAGLSERELEVLQAVARGLTNQAISKQLWIAEQTVKFHLTRIYKKLGVDNRTQATRVAYQRGLVDTRS